MNLYVFEHCGTYAHGWYGVIAENPEEAKGLLIASDIYEFQDKKTQDREYPVLLVEPVEPYPNNGYFFLLTDTFALADGTLSKGIAFGSSDVT